VEKFNGTQVRETVAKFQFFRDNDYWILAINNSEIWFHAPQSCIVYRGDAHISILVRRNKYLFRGKISVLAWILLSVIYLQWKIG